MINKMLVTKLAKWPTGTPVGLPAKSQSNAFLKNATSIPATGPMVMAAINAGTSLKSTFKKAGKAGKGKLKSIKINEILLNIPMTIIDCNFLFFIFLSPCSDSPEERFGLCGQLHNKTLKQVHSRETRHI